MRVTIPLVLILAFVITLANARKIEKPLLKCLSPCNCRAIYKPVCGKSGVTHANACFATCYRDVVVKNGVCKKCKNPKPVKKSHCRWVRYGKNGRRKHCCTWLQSGGRRWNRKCGYRGPCHYTYKKVHCQMRKRNKCSQQYCCRWTKKVIGRKVILSKKKCSFRGHCISKSAKSGCRWYNLGRNRKRRKCCSVTSVCRHVGKTKKCKHKKKCKWTSRVIRVVVKNSCRFTRPRKGVSHRICCVVRRQCQHKKGCKKESCKVVSRKCRRTGHKIVRKHYKKCNWRTVGKTGKRLRCCQWIHHCRTGKKCKIQNKKCFWKGCAKFTTLKGSCVWRHRTKHVKQRLCCSQVQTCQCKKCHRSKTRCQWRGFKITTVKHSKCNWKAIGKNGRRRQCCEHKKVCFKGKCSKTCKCRWVGNLIVTTIINRCNWFKITKNSKRRKCCTFIRTRNGKKVTQRKIRCKFTGYVVVENPGKHCQLVNVGGGCKRLKCCSFTTSCRINGKSKKCRVVNRKCKYTGQRRWYIRRKSIRWLNVGKNAQRQYACTWIDYCVGSKKKCTPIKKRCKFVGNFRQTHSSTACRVRNRGKNVLQKQCCTVVRRCHCPRLGQRVGCRVVRNFCKWVGPRIVTTHSRKCFSVSLGKGASRTKCCTHSRKCHGRNCKTRVHSCSWSGPVCSTRTFNRCSYVKFGRNAKRLKCCVFIRSCRGRKCNTRRSRCYHSGPVIKVSVRRTCTWRKIGCYKQYYCCLRRLTHHNGKLKKSVHVRCYYTGKKYPISTTYFKKKYVKRQNSWSTTHCTYLYKCRRIGNKTVGCKHVKTIKCRTVNKVQNKNHVSCSTLRYRKGSRPCTRRVCTRSFFRRVGRGPWRCIRRSRYNAGREVCRNIVTRRNRCSMLTFGRGCRQRRCCLETFVNGRCTRRRCRMVGRRVCPAPTRCRWHRFRRRVRRGRRWRSVQMRRRRCCRGRRCWFVGAARADPHFDFFSGERDVSRPYTGIFNFYSNLGCTVQMKMEKAGTDSVITGVAVKCRVKGGKFRTVRLSTSYPSKKHNARISGKRGKRIGKYTAIRERLDAGSKTKFNLYKIRLRKAHLEVVYDKTNTNTLTVNIAVDEGVNFDKATGFIVKKASVESSKVESKDNLFREFISFSQLTPQRTEASLEEAKRKCSGVKNDLTDCIYDVQVTGLNYGALYKAEDLAMEQL